MLRRLVLLLLISPISFWGLQAQISLDETPPSFLTKQLDERVASVALPPTNLSTMRAVEQDDEVNGLPPRFGNPWDVNYNLENSGQWEAHPRGQGRIWRLSIKSPQALSINLCYDDFHMPEGGRLWIYNTDRSHVIGAFSSANNKKSGGFATGLVYGDEVILEYYEPYEVEGQGRLSISRAVHGYRYIDVSLHQLEDGAGSQEAFGGSGDCQVNVNCSPEGDNWQDEKRSIAMILVDGFRWCTGSLVNTTRGDCTPYFLTADHCLTDGYDAVSNPDMTNWSFYWMYESPGCTGATDFIPTSTNGATLVANDSPSDFALLLLTENPALVAGINPYFNGWYAGYSPATGGVGIHHPSGDLKMIATHSMTPSPDDWFGTAPANSHWRITWDATSNGHSVTEGGSSGSPLFDSNGRIIGQLHGGSSINCSDPINDPGIYGSLAYSWHNGSSSDIRRKLSPWLDPDATGITIVDGSYGSCENTCVTPSGLAATSMSANTANLAWTSVDDALGYDVRYRVSGTSSWTLTSTTSSNILISGLDGCTDYEFQVASVCDTSASRFSVSHLFTTDGCPCPTYCEAKGGSTSDEWLQTVQIGPLINTSGDNSGYINYTGTLVTASFERGASYPLSITPGYGGFAYGEYIKVYIDYNADGDYKDAGELAYDAGSTSTTTVTGTVVIPNDAQIGQTGMRVLMRWNTEPSDCGTFTYGEVEDYCITITEEAAACSQPRSLSADLSNLPGSFQLSWSAVSGATGYQILGKAVGAPSYRAVISNSVTKTLSGSALLPLTSYEWRVRAYCDGIFSDTSVVDIFTTPSFRPQGARLETRLYPNPARDRFYIDVESRRSGEAQIQIMDILGRSVLETQLKLDEGPNRLEVAAEQLPPGHYLIQLFVDDKLYIEQLSIK